MNTRLIDGMKRFLREEEGTEVVEWALVAGLIVAVGAGLFLAIGGHVGTIFEFLEGLLDDAATATGGAAGNGEG